MTDKDKQTVIKAHHECCPHLNKRGKCTDWGTSQPDCDANCKYMRDFKTIIKMML